MPSEPTGASLNRSEATELALEHLIHKIRRMLDALGLASTLPIWPSLACSQDDGETALIREYHKLAATGRLLTRDWADDVRRKTVLPTRPFALPTPAPTMAVAEAVGIVPSAVPHLIVVHVERGPVTPWSHAERYLPDRCAMMERKSASSCLCKQSCLSTHRTFTPRDFHSMYIFVYRSLYCSNHQDRCSERTLGGIRFQR
jgi:hypothetical protein